MTELVLTPSDFIATVNQTLEFAYPVIAIEGELTNFKISNNRWVYFDLKDDTASVRFFGTVYSLPGPLKDGLIVRVVGSPRLHPRFGFSINFRSILPVGEGQLKKASDLLFKKLEAEGLFAPERKRVLPELPVSIGLVTAASSAAAADFLKITNARWAGINIKLVDSLVQGEQAPGQLTKALTYLNQLPELPDIIVMVRGGGSADDLAAFSDERVVRAVAASRVPTLVAIGHEVDVSLAELAADARASTPSNAAEIAVPDKKHDFEILGRERQQLRRLLTNLYQNRLDELAAEKTKLQTRTAELLAEHRARLAAQTAVIRLLNPAEALKRGYAIIKRSGSVITNAAAVSSGDHLELNFSDGKIQAIAKGLSGE
jgi:exodeoxyribonuclease VII large subunit